MQIFTRLEDFPSLKKNTVAAIGNFDGIHLGHQHILRLLVNNAQKRNLISLVVTFAPHPEKFFGKKPVKMIQTIEQRLKEIERNKIEMVVVLPFSESIAKLSARDFIKGIMVDTAHARTVIVGENFHFGRNREGNVRVINELSHLFEFDFFSIPVKRINEKIISSSLIRTYLSKGDIETANQFLGRPYEISGSVVKGMSRGKNLGFPTVNISSSNEIFPGGVFISTVNIKDKPRPALTNIGQRPTFDQKETHVESHIINFSGDLYGQTLGIQLIKKIRDERPFKTAKHLSEQIAKDLATAKSFFKEK
jgi:riboflavin kinase/FMN adenylyltransferase